MHKSRNFIPQRSLAEKARAAGMSFGKIESRLIDGQMRTTCLLDGERMTTVRAKEIIESKANV